MIFAYSNPYHKNYFFDFFGTLIGRMWDFATGRLSANDLVGDEIQLLVLVFIAAACALVGSFLVLRRMTMLANSLSHTILLGIVLVYLLIAMGRGEASDYHEPLNLTAMLFAALASAFATTFLTEFLTRSIGLQEDASTGLVFTTLFALGVVLVTAFSRNAHIGTEVVMGNVNLLQKSDITLCFAVFIIDLLAILFFFKELQLTSFDSPFAATLGFSSSAFHYLMMALTSITAVGAFRAVGVLLVLAMMTGPALTARLLSNRLKPMIYLAVALGIFSSVVGVALTRHLWSAYQLALSTAGVIVCVIVALFIIAALFAPSVGIVAQYRERRKFVGRKQVDS